MEGEQRPSSHWLRPAASQSGLRRFIETIQAQLGLVLAIVAVFLGGAIAYLFTADSVYEAEAKLLISPVPATDLSLASLGLIRESSDPTLDIETAAQLVTTPEVAEEAAKTLGNDGNGEDLLADVKAEPVGQSNIVAVVAEAPTARAASDRANAFASSVIQVRTAALQDRIEAVLPALSRQLDGATEGSLTADSLAEQISQLEVLRAGSDPTLLFQTPAPPPDEAVWPRPLLTILGALVLGLAIGLAIAYLLRALDPRLRREEQLHEIYKLPILARIPRDPGASADVPLRPNQISPATIEAYRTLRATLSTPTGDSDRPPRSFLVTSPSPSEGKTSSALNLAAAIAMSGRRTILIEADLRRPMISEAVGFSPPRSIVRVLRREVELSEALVQAPGLGGNLALLMTGRPDISAPELFGLAAGERLIREAEALADYVVVDSPPLTAVVDSLPLAREVDSVVIVVRLGKTRLGRIREMGELLAGNGITPAGFVVVGTRSPGADQAYYYQREEYSQSQSRLPLRRGRRTDNGVVEPVGDAGGWRAEGEKVVARPAPRAPVSSPGTAEERK